MYHIRWKIRRDLPQVLGFDPTYTEEEILNLMRIRNNIGLVIEEGEKILGWLVYEILPKCLRLVHIMIHPDYQRSGIGTMMMDEVKSKLVSHHRISVVTHVSDENLPMHLFLRKNGFQAIEILREESAYHFRFIKEVKDEVQEVCQADQGE